VSCHATSLARSFEMTERLDMGRYDRTSVCLLGGMGSKKWIFLPKAEMLPVMSSL